MASITISLPDHLKQWIEQEVVGLGRHESLDAYLAALVSADRQQHASQLTSAELRQMIDDSRASGRGTKSVAEVFAAAVQAAKARRLG